MRRKWHGRWRWRRSLTAFRDRLPEYRSLRRRAGLLLRLEPADRAIRGRQVLRRRCVHLIDRDRIKAVAERVIGPPRRERLEVAELMRDVGDTVAVVDEPRAELRVDLLHFLGRDAVLAQMIDLPEHDLLARPQGLPF